MLVLLVVAVVVVIALEVIAVVIVVVIVKRKDFKIYLMKNSTHFIYSYLVSDILQRIIQIVRKYLLK